MRCRAGLVAAVLVAALAGCGGGDDTGTAATGTESSPSPAGTEATPAPAASGAAGASGGAGTALTAAVGTASNKDDFVLTVQDASGADVTTLPAGEYSIQVSDPSKIHNVHLSGDGVDEKTEVPGTGDVTWTVTLKAGSYTVVCDPHPQMRVEIEVT